MGFEKAHQAFLERHLHLRTGERKGRLLRGHNYAEKLLLQNVWWPLFGSLDQLHPEYEIYDWNRIAVRDWQVYGMVLFLLHFVH
ncbi:hypothetical protein SAMN04487897_10740 [Paenibacillus sp. yr247]|nr:hypothetical protein SAMN04487897_10740 [Paenibacillus sp. yr247]